VVLSASPHLTCGQETWQESVKIQAKAILFSSYENH